MVLFGGPVSTDSTAFRAAEASLMVGMIRTCRGVRADGAPCGAPEHLVSSETHFCPAHGPGASKRMADRGRRGAESTARRLRSPGLDAEELPELQSHEDAQAWLETI